MSQLFGVQAARCAPYATAFREGVEHLVPTEVAPTVAEGIPTSRPTRVAEVLRAVRDTGGSIVAVQEAEIVEALRAHPRGGRGWPEPAPGFRLIRPQEYTVLVLTGSGSRPLPPPASCSS